MTEGTRLGQVVAITGCTTGTGYFAALTFAKCGARVIMLNRKSERAETALSKIREAVPDAKVEHVDCDLTDFASVKKAAAELQSLCSSGLDVLCNNAGVMALADEATADGFDVQMQTNHLSHFLLTREVFPLLEKAAEKNGEVCCPGPLSSCLAFSSPCSVFRLVREITTNGSGDGIKEGKGVGKARPELVGDADVGNRRTIAFSSILSASAAKPSK